MKHLESASVYVVRGSLFLSSEYFIIMYYTQLDLLVNSPLSLSRPPLTPDHCPVNMTYSSKQANHSKSHS